MLASLLALAVMLCAAAARAEGADGKGAAVTPPGSGASSASPAMAQPGAAQPAAGAQKPDAQKPAVQSQDAKDQVVKDQGNDLKKNGGPSDDGRVGPAGEGTDEDAATLPEPDDGKPRRGAEGPPPAPRGPTAYAGLPTLLPSPAEAGHIDEVELPKRTMAILSGRSSWDDGFKSLFDSFDAIAAELAKAGVKPGGRPLAVFVSTDENGFSFEAMTPVAAAPADAAKVGGGVRFGESPAGKAIRFTHKAPYEEIDTTYEAITAYLDSRNIAAQDAFIEEYVTDPKDPSDATLQINIYVQPKPAGGDAGKNPANSAPVNPPQAGQKPDAAGGQTPATTPDPASPKDGPAGKPAR
ncbi:GyrI-like domain-containing protein [Camelimonas sp. ID_303_24]